MGDVLRPPTRAQMQKVTNDLDFTKALEILFRVTGLQPGDIIYSGAMTRAGALAADGAAVSRTLYPKLFRALTPNTIVTITIASPGVVTWTAHGLAANTKVVLVTNGALPTGLVAGTVYFVKTVLSANTFSLSATAGGAAINTSGTQSGVHTMTAFPFGNGDGSTTFEVPSVSAVSGCRAFVIY